jgi:hypothetical protein
MKKLFLLLSFLTFGVLLSAQTINLHNVVTKAYVDSKCKNTTVKWVVQIEDHVDYYVIESGTDINSLDSVHYELGGVWSVEPTEYSWKDTVKLSETRHYRVKTVYWNGVYEYSNMVAARCWRNDE